MPIIIRTAAGVEVLDGQGVAPAAATIERDRSEGLTAIPGTGLLAATVPSSFATWSTVLERWACSIGVEISLDRDCVCIGTVNPANRSRKVPGNRR